MHSGGGACWVGGLCTSRLTLLCRVVLRSIRTGPAGDLELWIDRSYVLAGYGWSFPADDELRIGVGSFDPRYHVKEPTVRLAEDLGEDAVRYQGNWIPHKIRPAAEDGVFFVGDSAGHCLPLTAEGIRTAWYFGIACGRELQAVIDGRATRERGSFPLRRLQSRARVEVRLDAARAASRAARPAAAPAPASSARWAAALASTGRSVTTCGSPRRRQIGRSRRRSRSRPR